MAELIQDVWLILLGFGVGAYGTLIGAGGGFILVPLLLLLYPGTNSETITCISLAVVFVNALSGTAAYARMRRVDFRSGVLFAVATVPGAVLGALTTPYLPRHAFDGLLGALLVLACAYLLLRPHAACDHTAALPNGHTTRRLVEANGTVHTWSFNPVVGVVLSVFVGFLSSLLGIGGGIIHVPALTHLLHFPVHVATATSHFILAVMALAGTVVHAARGELAPVLGRVAFLALGVLAGAQLGARLSNRLHGDWIIRGLAIALGLVGARLAVPALLRLLHLAPFAR
jgi:uncharacterized membrane protein YfcA